MIRDASDVYRVDDTAAFRRLLRYGAASIGTLVNLTEWAASVELDRRTVRRYLDFMQDAHLIRLVEPWTGGKRAELTGTPKLYFVDNGLRNRLGGSLAPWDERSDHGPLFENFVFAELSKALPWTDPLRYCRSKSRAEVDFVLELNGHLVGIEAKAGTVDRAPSRGAWSFIQAYRPAELWTAYLGETGEEQRDGVTLRWLHPADLGAHLQRITLAQGL